MRRVATGRVAVIHDLCTDRPFAFCLDFSVVAYLWVRNLSQNTLPESGVRVFGPAGDNDLSVAMEERFVRLFLA